jgi:hypothetical protein
LLAFANTDLGHLRRSETMRDRAGCQEAQNERQRESFNAEQFSVPADCPAQCRRRLGRVDDGFRDLALVFDREANDFRLLDGAASGFIGGA